MVNECLWQDGAGDGSAGPVVHSAGLLGLVESAIVPACNRGEQVSGGTDVGVPDDGDLCVGGRADSEVPGAAEVRGFGLGRRRPHRECKQDCQMAKFHGCIVAASDSSVRDCVRNGMHEAQYQVDESALPGCDVRVLSAIRSRVPQSCRRRLRRAVPAVREVGPLCGGGRRKQQSNVARELRGTPQDHPAHCVRASSVSSSVHTQMVPALSTSWTVPLMDPFL